jgi:hypothetical protein
MSDRRITWSLAMLYRNGAYNSTFTFDVIQPAFDLVSQYFQVAMPRVSANAQVRVIQSNINRNNWAAWTTGNTIYISPTFNFGRSRRRCAKVAVHEFGHIGNGTSHSNNLEALMSADGGTSQGWVQDDMRWFGRYRLRGAMPPRGIFATTFGAMAMGEELIDKLPLGVANGVWDRFRDMVRPTYQMREQES